MNESILREQLRGLLDWSDAHVTFDRAVVDVPEQLRGTRVDGFPHSLWELVEHIRIAQADILEFCRNPGYEEREWPKDYWPATAAPPAAVAWDESVNAVVRDRTLLQALATTTTIPLDSAIPHGAGQTYLRELVLVADHTSYHVGQIVLLRQLLGIWETS